MRYLLIILGVLLVGCYTPKRASFQVTKAQSIHPKIVAEKCASFYPTKDSISIVEKLIKGKTDTLLEEILVDCDTVVETKYRKGRVVTKYVPKYIKHNDTIRITKTKVVENTAKVDALGFEIAQLTEAGMIDRNKVKKRTTIMWISIGLNILLLVVFFLLSKSFGLFSKNKLW